VLRKDAYTVFKVAVEKEQRIGCLAFIALHRLIIVFMGFLLFCFPGSKA
jgi:hypothetical protein